jgi:hypothetical protein
MRDAPTRRPKHPAPLYKRVLQWTLGIVVSAIILVGVVLLGVRFFAPNLGAEVREATVRIEEIASADASPDGRPMPIVILEEKRTWLRDPPSSPAEAIAQGTWVHVVYTWIPATDSCRVMEWRVVDAPPGEVGS